MFFWLVRKGRQLRDSYGFTSWQTARLHNVYSVYELAVLVSSNYVHYLMQFKVQFSVGAKDFSLFESSQPDAGTFSLPIQWLTENLSKGVKRPET